MTTIQGKVAALTGAGSGLGRALAIALAERGATLALADVDARGLAETCALLASRGSEVSTHVVDVGQLAAMRRFAEQVRERHGGADILINNAGTAVRATIEELSYADLARVLDVNLWGVIHGTKEFLPLLRMRPEAHIVNIGSVNSFVPFPENAPYNVSKYAVLGWSETLMQELHGSQIRVTCVHPGALDTNLVKNSRGFTREDHLYFAKLSKTSPARAALSIVRAIEHNRQQLLIGSDARLLALLKRIAPRWIVRFVGVQINTPRVRPESTSAGLAAKADDER